MKIIKTRKQVEVEKLATRLDVLRELNKREALDVALKGELYRLEQGHVGEQFVLDAIEEFGQPHWRVMQNVWLEYYGKFECDLLLMTRAGICAVEVKHYSENFVYSGNQCYLNGNTIGHNAVSQAIKSSLNFQNMLADAGYRPAVKSGLIFTGEFCDVRIDDQVDDLNIVMRHQLRSFIRKIADEERGYRGPKLDVEKVFRIIEGHESESHFMPKLIEDRIYDNIKPGILCAHCGAFEIEIMRKEVICKLCGTRESRENAIVRTICEYGVIYNEKELVTSNLCDFFNHIISGKTLRRYLIKHFEERGNRRSSHFVNKKLPFAILNNKLILPDRKLMILTDYR